MTTKPFTHAFFKGKIVPLEEAKVSIMTKALQYGIGVFGGIRGYYDSDSRILSLFRVEDHFTRLLSSCNILGTRIPYSVPELQQIMRDLVLRNKPATDCYFRPFAYAGETTLAPRVPDVSDFALYMIPLDDYLPTATGLSVMVSSWRRVSDNAIPPRGKVSGSYVNSALAREEAARFGCDEAVILTEAGNVAEGSAENIFIVRKGTLVTPAQSDGVLEGITRDTILTLARDMDIPVEIRTVSRTELYAAEEVFFTGTGAQVAWVKSVDGRKIGNGERGKVTAALQDTFFKVVRNKDRKYSRWLTNIHV